MNRRLFVQGFLSLVVGGVCVVYAVHGMDGHAVLGALRALAPSAVALYLGTMVVTHLFRTLRWEYLLRALGTSLPFRRLLPIPPFAAHCSRSRPRDTAVDSQPGELQ